MRRLAALANAGDPFGKLFVEGVGTGARRLGLEIEPVAVRPGEPLEPAFETMAGRKADAVITMSTIFRKEVVDPAAKHHMPLLSTARLVPVSGEIRRSAPMVQPACLKLLQEHTNAFVAIRIIGREGVENTDPPGRSRSCVRSTNGITPTPEPR